MTKNRKFITGAICGFLATVYATFVICIYCFIGGVALPVFIEAVNPMDLVFCELDTWLNVGEFVDPWLFAWEGLQYESVSTVKVLNYEDDSAGVLYLLDDYQVAFVNNYTKKDGGWVRTETDLIWSEEPTSMHRSCPAPYEYMYRFKVKYSD